MNTFFTIIHIIASAGVIGSVLLQPSKTAGLAGITAGGAETFFGKNKGRSYEGKLVISTIVFMIIFVVTTVGLTILGNK